MAIKIWSFTGPTTHKKIRNNKNFSLCFLVLMSLPPHWQVGVWKDVTSRQYHGIAWHCMEQPHESWWALLSQTYKKSAARLENFSPDSWTLLVCQIRVPCTHNVTQDQPLLSRKYPCQTRVECQEGSCVCQLAWSLSLEYHKSLY